MRDEEPILVPAEINLRVASACFLLKAFKDGVLQSKRGIRHRDLGAAVRLRAC